MTWVFGRFDWKPVVDSMASSSSSLWVSNSRFRTGAFVFGCNEPMDQGQNEYFRFDLIEPRPMKMVLLTSHCFGRTQWPIVRESY